MPGVIQFSVIIVNSAFSYLTCSDSWRQRRDGYITHGGIECSLRIHPTPCESNFCASRLFGLDYYIYSNCGVTPLSHLTAHSLLLLLWRIKQVIPVVLGEGILGISSGGGASTLTLDSTALLKQLILMVLAPTALGASIRASVPGMSGKRKCLVHR
jgi:hypothetical protein